MGAGRAPLDVGGVLRKGFQQKGQQLQKLRGGDTLDGLRKTVGVD